MNDDNNKRIGTRLAQLLTSLVIGTLTGCAAIGSRIVDDRYFAGVRCDYEMCFCRSSIDPKCRVNPAIAVIDFPFSLIADIVFLPFDHSKHDQVWRPVPPAQGQPTEVAEPTAAASPSVGSQKVNGQ
jgi:uncharacterized protein YceK